MATEALEVQQDEAPVVSPQSMSQSELIGLYRRFRDWPKEAAYRDTQGIRRVICAAILMLAEQHGPTAEYDALTVEGFFV
jgi:hypothetical protein